ncbi:MAG: dTMP kinase [Acidimicrobiales bacterium]
MSGGAVRRVLTRGRLVALEGGEACGKSTQAALLAGRLGAVLTHEPGATGLGRRLRELVLGSDAGRVPLDSRAEALLLAADRAQHVAEVVAPALAAGRHVVTDRFSGSTLAYQGHGRGLDLGELARLSSWASQGVEPDVVVLLDVEPAEAATRQGSRTLDRMEAEADGFHERVRAGYLSLAAADPGRWVRVDGSGTAAEVAVRVWEAVSGRLFAGRDDNLRPRPAPHRGPPSTGATGGPVSTGGTGGTGGPGGIGGTGGTGGPGGIGGTGGPGGPPGPEPGPPSATAPGAGR